MLVADILVAYNKRSRHGIALFVAALACSSDSSTLCTVARAWTADEDSPWGTIAFARSSTGQDMKSIGTP
jgi:hypothetical protein